MPNIDPESGLSRDPIPPDPDPEKFEASPIVYLIFIALGIVIGGVIGLFVFTTIMAAVIGALIGLVGGILLTLLLFHIYRPK